MNRKEGPIMLATWIRLEEFELRRWVEVCWSGFDKADDAERSLAVPA